MPQVLPKEARRKKIQEELTAREDDATDSRAEELPWQGNKAMFPIIDLPLDAVVLNPSNHRIRSQTLSHPRRDLLEEDPFSQEAQELIAHLLRESGEYIREKATYEELKRDLDQFGQDQVGVITRDGILINGNRRAVALEDVGKRYIEVAVLPKRADNKELTELEGHLQMRRRLRDEYSFTNRLLYIHERLEEYGDSKDQLAELLRIEDTSEIDRTSRIYGYIEEARQLVGGDLTLTFFDDKEQILNDIDKHCQSLKNQGKDEAAERLRRTRLLGMIAGVGYQPLRDYADEDFFDSYVTDAWQSARDEDEENDDEYSLPALTAFARNETKSQDELGLDLLGRDGDTDEAKADPASLAKALATAKENDEVKFEGDNEEAEVHPGSKFVGRVKAVIRDAFEEAELDQNRADRLAEPADRLRKAQKHLKRVVPALKKADQDPAFDWSQLQKRYGQIQRSMTNIEDYLQARSRAPDDEG